MYKTFGFLLAAGTPLAVLITTVTLYATRAYTTVDAAIPLINAAAAEVFKSSPTSFRHFVYTNHGYTQKMNAQ